MTVENYPNLFLVSDQDFEQSVLNSTLPVIVDFTADGCAPCRVLAPIFARLSDSYNGKLRFAMINVGQNPLVVAQQRVMGTPTLILFAGGRPVGQVVGPHPGRLQQSVEGLLAKVGASV